MESRLTKQEFYNKVSVISFFLSILIMSIHCYNVHIYGLSAAEDPLSRAAAHFEISANKLEAVCVPMFYVISGYLFFRGFTPEQLFPKWKRRIFTLLIPYVLWCTLSYLFYVLVSLIPPVAARVNPESTKLPTLSFASWLSCLRSATYTPLWFLSSLMVLTLLAPVIWLLFRNHLKKVPTGIIFLLISFLIKEGIIRLHVPYNVTNYFIGAYIGMNHPGLPFRRAKKLSVYAGIGILLVIISVFTGLPQDTEIRNLLLIGLIWIFTDHFDLDREIPWFFRISFFLYCAHLIPLTILDKLFLIAFGKGPVQALVSYVMNPPVITVFLTGVAFLLRKYLPGAWKLLTGSRG